MALEAVISCRNRETGAVIEVWRAEDLPGSQDTGESKPWVTRCVEHGEMRLHSTRGQASVAARRPLLSCGECFWEQLAEGKSPVANEYAAALRGLYATTPKAVFAAVAVSVLTGCRDDLGEARELMVKEWRLLHGLGIIPQAPPPKLATP